MKLNGNDLKQAQLLLGRDPNIVEQAILSTMWSEHCSYKSSKSILKTYFKGGGRDVLIGIGEDAGVVSLGDFNGETYGVVVAHESHNHPSQVLPIEGAATGVGGVVRDVCCMGAEIIGVLNSLHFGIDPASPFVNEIAQKVVQGVSDYANPLGVPVLGGETIFHSSYNENCLVNVAAVGLVKASKVVHSFVPKCAATVPYDLILLGKSTDATGFGGASFSSATLDSANEMDNIGAVQVHDPFMQRVLTEAIKAVLNDAHDHHIEIGFKDLGAGGISCAASEIAAHSGFGCHIHLDAVNVVSDSLPPHIIACSETQERFCLAVPREYSATVLSIVNDQFEMANMYPNAGAAIIGHVVNEQSFVLFYNQEKVSDLPIQAITTDVQVTRDIIPRIPTVSKKDVSTPSSTTIHDLCMSILPLPNVRSKEYVYRHFDSGVKGQTVVYPGEADAVVLKPFLEQSIGIATSMDSNLYGAVDAYVAGAYAVAESIRNIISVGASPIALTDCLNFGNPEIPENLFDFQEGVKGISDAAQALSFYENDPIPIVSGNVSFYNESKSGSAVVPSPVVMAVGKVLDIRKVVTPVILEAGLRLIVLGERYSEFGGSQLAEIFPDCAASNAPAVRFDDEQLVNMCVYECIQAGLIKNCHDVSQGGVWVSLCEMFLAGAESPLGASLSIPEQSLPFLFSESGGYIIAIDETCYKKVIDRLTVSDICYYELGNVIEEPMVHLHFQEGEQLDFSISDLRASWSVKLVNV